MQFAPNQMNKPGPYRTQQTGPAYSSGLAQTVCFIFTNQIQIPGERLLKIIHDYKPAFYMAGPYHVQAMYCLDVGDFDLSSLFCIMPNGGMITTG